MQKARGHTVRRHSAPTACKQTVSGSISLPHRVLFTFPSRYWFTIGHQVVFSLGRWSSQIPTGFHVSRGTRGHPRVISGFRVRGYHPLWSAFPDRSAIHHQSHVGALQPQSHKSLRFGLFRVRSPLLTESLLISFPAGT